MRGRRQVMHSNPKGKAPKMVVDGRAITDEPVAASWLVPRREAGVRKGAVKRDVPMQIVFDSGKFYSIESAGTPAEKFVEIKNPARIAALKRQLEKGER